MKPSRFHMTIRDIVKVTAVVAISLLPITSLRGVQLNGTIPLSLFTFCVLLSVVYRKWEIVIGLFVAMVVFSLAIPSVRT